MSEVGRILTADQANTNWPLLVIGACMIVAGVVIPGTQTQIVLALIVVGAGLAVAGALSSQFKQLEIGLQGIKVSRDEDGAGPITWLAVEAEALGRVAQLVLNDRDLAGEVLEGVLSRVRSDPRVIPSHRIGIATFKTLVSALHRADKRMWLSGSGPAGEIDGIYAALRTLAFPERVAFALNMEMPEEEVAEILNRSKSDVLDDIRAAEKALSPHLGTDAGGSDVQA